MLNESLIKRIVESMNSVPCPYCGVKHTFSVDVEDNVIGYSFPDDACDKFKDNAPLFLRKKMIDFGIVP